MTHVDRRRRPWTGLPQDMPSCDGQPRAGSVVPRLLSVLLLAACSVAAGAAESGSAPADADAEIRLLLDHLAASGCRFERNGRWHSAAEARDHLAGKLARARALRLQGDAEAFIDGAATRSSLTGRPYRVACGEAAPVPAGPWLRQALASLRQRSAETSRTPASAGR